MAPRTTRPDFPVHQLIALSICRLVEPIAFTSLFPYIYYMVAHFHVTKTDAEIAMWTGGTVAAFAFAEMLTGMMWGSLSDRIGRKPVLIGGLTGTGISMLLFGLAPTMPLALAARAFGGLLNGNVGVIQTAVAELVPKREYQPRAFSVMPFVWSLGSIIGPSVGGMLAEPVKHYPKYFSPDGLFGKFPYLLPNLACFIICCVGVINGILFLDETHPELIDKPDRGRDIGYWIQDTLSVIFWRDASEKHPDTFSQSPESTTPTDPTEDTPLLSSSPSTPGPSTPTSTSPTLTSSSRAPSVTSLKSPTVPKPFVTTWTPQVIHNVFAYAIIAFHTITYDQMLSVFLQSPSSATKLISPIFFNGGFSLDTQTMGLLFSYQGILSTLFQFLAFAPIVRFFGVLRTFRFVAMVYPFIYFLSPYLAFLPHNNDGLLFSVIYSLLSAKTVCGCLIYPINSILLTNAAPSLLVLGTINGVAGSVASCMRAIAPVLMGWLYSKGVERGIMGLSWWISGLVAAIGGVQAFYIFEDTEDDEEKVMDLRTEQGGEGDNGLATVVAEDAVKCLEPGEVIIVKGGKDGNVIGNIQNVSS
ncbi:hypothetical protein H072_489 [Dactylellina haptotyla CBS 200.50]|uniref:Major facilitator superfamily (MFS) profile domain-containing protein n=1 Tax=Dactylellina haptotyla (strain CBS 200.50) TaxID=1284197 RepID=S8ARD0_DACHA|nr:hypothetical protein H072_489 [Dactylellina haptotyla CBS 200.50]